MTRENSLEILRNTAGPTSRRFCLQFITTIFVKKIFFLGL